MTEALPQHMQVIERGWLSANLIIFKDPKCNTAIDSGYVSHSAQTLALVSEVLRGEPLHQLFNTHLHSDHCGGNATLQSAYVDLETFIPPGQAKQVEQWDPIALSYEPTGQNCPRFRFNGLLEPGSVVILGGRTWEIHAAPGHDPNSVVLFERMSRCLISADALWENGFGVVFPELEGTDAFAAVGDTLNLIESMQPKLIIPGHGPVFDYSNETMNRARNRLSAFINDPVKHAKHASKVLLKFKLLEMQCQKFDDFIMWARTTPHLSTIHQRYFSTTQLTPWLHDMVLDLVKSKVALVKNGEIINV